MAKKKKKTYKDDIEPYLDKITELAKEGLRNDQIAKKLKIEPKSFSYHVSRNKKLADAIVSGREQQIENPEVYNELKKLALSAIMDNIRPHKVIKRQTRENITLGKRMQITQIVTDEEERVGNPDLAKWLLTFLDTKFKDKGSDTTGTIGIIKIPERIKDG